MNYEVGKWGSGEVVNWGIGVWEEQIKIIS